MATTHKTGGEVDAFCSKCNLNLAHTILALVGSKIAKVKCNTCTNEHVYRGIQTAMQANSFTKPRKSTRLSAADKVVIGFQQRIEGKDAAKARTYSARDTYALEELISHPTFGLGIVSDVRADKVTIHFKADEKTLVHGRGAGAQAAKPAFNTLHPSTSGRPQAKPAEEPAAPTVEE